MMMTAQRVVCSARRRFSGPIFQQIEQARCRFYSVVGRAFGRSSRAKWVTKVRSWAEIDSGRMSLAADAGTAGAMRSPQLSAVEELLLQCLRSDTARSAASPFPETTSIDWDRVVFLSDSHGVTELLLDRLAKAGANPPGPIRHVLQQRVIDATGANLARTRQIADVLQRLRAGGIRAIAFKGPTLAVTAYGHLGRRSSADIDLLVHPADATRVRPLLLQNGYVLPNRRKHRGGSLIYGLYPAAGRDDTLLPAGDGLAAVDVHVAFAYWTLGIRLDTPALLDRAVTVDVAGVPIPTCCADDLLLVLTIHGMMHGWSLLRYICDIDAVSRLVSNWTQVLEHARAARLLRPLSVALLLAERTLHTAVPPEIASITSRDREAAQLAGQCRNRLFDLDWRNRDWDPWPWFLSFQASPRDRMRFRVRSLIYEWLLKWPWDDWLGRRPPQDARDQA